MSESKSLCPACSNSIRCETWAEWKCTARKRRIYGWVDLTLGKKYKKRPKNWKEPPCRCKDCLENDKLSEEREEE